MLRSLSIILVLSMLLVAAPAAAGADPVPSPATGKVGETFTLTEAGGNFSYTQNTLTYYDSSGTVVMTENVPGYGAGDYGGNDIQVQSLFPVLQPGAYSLSVQNPESGWTSGKLSFTIEAGGVYPKISVLLGVSGLAQIPEIAEFEQEIRDELQIENISLNIDRLAVIVLSSQVSSGYDPIPAKVTFGAQTMDAVALTFFQGIVITSVPAGVSGPTAVKVKINNYETAPLTLDILDPSKYSLLEPNGGEAWNGGDAQVMRWSGDVPALGGLIAGRNFFKSLTGDEPEGEVYPLSEEFISAPFSWTVPEAMPSGSDYKLGLVFYKGPTPEELERYAENYTPDSAPLSLFFHLVLSKDFFTITEQRHPFGTLVRDEAGTVYEIINTARMAFPSVSVFRSYGYEFKDVVSANAADMALPLGVAPYARGDLIGDRGTVYIIDGQQKFGFSSKKVFEQQDYQFGNVFPGDW